MRSRQGTMRAGTYRGSLAGQCTKTEGPAAFLLNSKLSWEPLTPEDPTCCASGFAQTCSSPMVSHSSNGPADPPALLARRSALALLFTCESPGILGWRDMAQRLRDGRAWAASLREPGPCQPCLDRGRWQRQPAVQERGHHRGPGKPPPKLHCFLEVKSWGVHTMPPRGWAGPSP